MKSDIHNTKTAIMPYCVHPRMCVRVYKVYGDGGGGVHSLGSRYIYSCHDRIIII